MKKKLFVFFALLSAVILSSCASNSFCPAYADNSIENTEERTN